jgi:hypothetical protein
MPVTSSFHSENPNDQYEKKVYHNNTSCQSGRAIDPNYKKSGTGNRPLCETCSKNTSEGK